MFVGYEWVPLLLARLHGIEPYEVVHVLEDKRPRWPRQAVGSGGIRMLAIWGRTRVGRRLIIVLRPTVSHNWLIIGAMEMTAAQAAEFDRWEAEYGR